MVNIEVKKDKILIIFRYQIPLRIKYQRYEVAEETITLFLSGSLYYQVADFIIKWQTLLFSDRLYYRVADSIISEHYPYPHLE